MLTEQQLAALRSEPGSNRVAKAMALAGVTQVDPRDGAPPDAALRQRCRPRALSHHYRRECLEVRRLFRLPYRGLVPVTPPTIGLKAGRTLEMDTPPAVMSLVTPTPACTGEIDRERRPRCSIVDRAAGAAWRRDPCRSPSLSSSPRSGVPPAAVHHDGLMAAGRILADGIGMSPGARERVGRFGPAPRSVRSSARCSPVSGSFRVAQSGRSWRSLSARSTDSALLACARVGETGIGAPIGTT